MKKLKLKNHVFLVVAGLVLMVGLTIFAWMYYNQSIREIGIDESGNTTNYSRHYVMIVDNPQSSFWESVYSSAKLAAASEDALLEVMGDNMTTEYQMSDYMEMSIAAKVDGIFLESTNEQGLAAKINKAVEAGIPVITLLEDNSASRRQSFIGVNSYQLAQIYGDQVANLVTDQTRRIMVLTHGETGEGNQSQIYNQINNTLIKSQNNKGQVEVETYNVGSSSTFDSEEAVRDIFTTLEGPPDILVCLDEVDTECAYQAVIDFNEVGNVQIVGYYTSDPIREGLENDVISMTFELDAAQMGERSVEAMTEYLEYGRVSDYFSIDMNLITKANVEDYIKADE